MCLQMTKQALISEEFLASGGAALIAKAQFGVGVLGLPQTFDVLGFIPGLISIIGLLLLSTWAGFVMGKFRLAHPNIHNVGDAACLMFGKRVGDIFGYAFCLLYTLLMTSTPFLYFRLLSIRSVVIPFVLPAGLVLGLPCLLLPAFSREL